MERELSGVNFALVKSEFKDRRVRGAQNSLNASARCVLLDLSGTLGNKLASAVQSVSWKPCTLD